jgi:methyl-accepting chemotaxis protein
VFAAASFTAYQFGIDRLQAQGFPVFCLPQPSAWQVTLHILFVLAQASAEVILARGMAAMAAEGEELAKLVEQVDRGDVIALDVGQVPARTPAGLTLKRTIERMEAAVSALRRGTSSIHTACGEIASGNRDLSSRTEQTAVNLQRTTSSVVGLAATVKQSDAHALAADELARRARDVAADGGSVIAEVATTMKDITQSSERIADIIGLIDGISFQTNILALNASVEAARAGEQGRGFAVVADEVRNLASRSAQAAQEIRGLIEESVGRVARGAALMDRAGATMGDIVGAVEKVNRIMSELSASSRQQASEVSEIGQVMTRMDQATQQNAAMVEQMAAAAGSLKSQADELARAVEVFSIRGALA